MAADRKDSERSPLEGLGSPRQGAHRPGGSHAGGLLASLVAVVAVVGLLVGLYTAFGRPGDGKTAIAARDDGGDAAASVSPRATPVATPNASLTPSAAAGASAGTATRAGATVSATAGPSRTPRASHRSSPTASPTATRTSAARTLPVVVLNQSRVTGRAARTAARVRSLGWSVSGVGNFRGGVASTTVYYPSGGFAAAQALAAQLGIGRVRPAFAGVSQTVLTVVLV